MKAVTAAEANRQSSSLLRTVAQGETVLFTSRGKPVATLSLAGASAARTTRETARQQLLAHLVHSVHLAQVRATGLPRDWTRVDLWER